MIALLAAAAVAHSPIIEVRRLPLILVAAQGACPQGTAKAENDIAAALHFNLAEKAAMLGMCILYHQGRLRGINDAVKDDLEPSVPDHR